MTVTGVAFGSPPTEPTFRFGDAEYSVDESAGGVDVQVWRAGTDLSGASSVTLSSQKTDPPSASGERSPIASFRRCGDAGCLKAGTPCPR